MSRLDTQTYGSILRFTRPTSPKGKKTKIDEDQDYECPFHAPTYLLPKKLISKKSTTNIDPALGIRDVEFKSHIFERTKFNDERTSPKSISLSHIKRTRKPGNKWDLLKRDSPRSRKLARSLLINFTNEDDFKLSKSVNLQQYGIDAGLPITNAIVQEVCNMNPHITKIDLTDCIKVNDVGLWAISKSLNQILEIKLGGCTEITNIGLRSLTLQCSTIQLIDLSNCVHLDDHCLRIIASNLRELESLLLCFCSKITDNGVSEVAKCCRKLKILRLRNCEKIGEFGDRALLEIGKYSKLLTTLDLYGCNHVADPGIKAVARGCAHITDFQLSGCSKVTNAGINALSSGCLKLVSFTLAKCIQIHDVNMSRLIQGFPSLVQLDLSDCISIGCKSVESIATIPIMLRVLTLSRCISIYDSSLLILAQGCKNLRSLKLDGCKHIKPKGVKEFVSSCPHISFLDLSDCKAIKQAFLYEILPILSYCDVSNTIFGFEPKPNEGELRKKAVFHIKQIQASIILQKCIRGTLSRKGEIIERRNEYRLKHKFPKLQAQIRGYIQRNVYQIKLTNRINTQAANFIKLAWKRSISRGATKKLNAAKSAILHKRNSAIIIQCMYRGHRGRSHSIEEKVRNSLAFLRMKKHQEKQNQAAILIQVRVRSFLGRSKFEQLVQERKQTKEKLAKEDFYIRNIQRILRGYRGRQIAQRAIVEKIFKDTQSNYANKLQSAWRGRKGRKYARKCRDKKHQECRLRALKVIQNFFRASKNRFLREIARSVKILCNEEEQAAVFIERVYRGKLARRACEKIKINLEILMEKEVSTKNIQRMFRGYRGRAIADVLNGMKEMESKAQPLFFELSIKEDKLKELQTAKRLTADSYETLMEEVRAREREILVISQTTSKYWDSTRITGAPQRFITFLLKERLEEQLIICHNDVKKLKAKTVSMESDERIILREIRQIKREIQPLTKGVKEQILSDRPKRLREKVRVENKSSLKIQKVIRGYYVRAKLRATKE